MNLKKLIKKVAKNELENKILPMPDGQAPTGKKAKIAGGLAVVAAIATALSQYLS
jgi:hypothetical protein